MTKITKKGEYLDILLRSQKTVFSTKDVALLWGAEDSDTVSVRLNYYVKHGKLIRLHRGLYAKDKNYNRRELANKLYTPSYISFETVLLQEGLTFQWYDTVFLAGRVSRELEVDGQKYEFNKLKDDVLTNTLGIVKKDNYYIATKERAFLDRIYLNGKYHFDNLDGLNWDKCFEIVKIYNQKSMIKKLQSYYDDYKDEK